MTDMAASDPSPPPTGGPVPIRTGGAPVLFVPDVLPPDLCAALMAAHDADHSESGMLRDVDGRIDLVPDAAAKVRTDHHLRDPALNDRVMRALAEKVLPAIRTAFAYSVTRLERIKIVAYDADGGGHFAAHRDNTTPDAAHRRFALTLNLNDGYSGGVLRFPDFGTEAYAPPPGGAVVFSCGLLHEVLPVTEGRRYTLLTFFYGDREAAARAKAGGAD